MKQQQVKLHIDEDDEWIAKHEHKQHRQIDDICSVRDQRCRKRPKPVKHMKMM